MTITLIIIFFTWVDKNKIVGCNINNIFFTWVDKNKIDSPIYKQYVLYKSIKIKLHVII